MGDIEIRDVFDKEERDSDSINSSKKLNDKETDMLDSYGNTVENLKTLNVAW